MTSVVFGALEHLPPQTGICRVLARAQGPEKPSWWSEISAVTMQYWPWSEGSVVFDGAEPDVVLQLSVPGRPSQVLVVECKRDSGKSGIGERDQLARQIENVAIPPGAQLAGLIYITQNICRPEHELNASRIALRRSTTRRDTPIWWISWRDITPLLLAVVGDATAARLARDAGACLKRWGMMRFGGIDFIRPAPVYEFKMAYRFDGVRVAPSYSFQGAKR